MSLDQVLVVDGISRIDVLELSSDNILLTETNTISVLETAPAQGVPGVPGKSAYQIALDAGYVGTQEEWLASLQGEDAYDAAVANGFTGTYEEWVNASTPQLILVTDAQKLLTNDGVTTLWSDLTTDQIATKTYVGTNTTPASHVGTGGLAHAVATTLAAGFMSAADKSKLDGVAANATANSSDATLLNRANHTGSQAISTVTGLQTALDGKRAKEATIEVTTSRSIVAGDEGNYLRSTATTPINLTVGVQSDGFITNLRVAGTGAVTLVASGTTLNPPAGGTLVCSNGMTVSLRWASSTVVDIIGQTEAA